MNGQEKGIDNYTVFKKWVSSKDDSYFREMVLNGRLSRTEICRECQFARSVLTQNPRVKALLEQLEDRLRGVGILPMRVPSDKAAPLRANGQMQSLADCERVKKLEAENAGLRAELDDLRKRLKRFEAIKDVLSETGRLPR
jgi:hypothetical protein